MTYEELKHKLHEARQTTVRRKAARDKASDDLRLARGGGDRDYIGRAQWTFEEAAAMYEAAERVEETLQRQFNLAVGTGENPPALSGRYHTDAATGRRYKITTRSEDGRVVERLRVAEPVVESYMEAQERWRKKWRESDEEFRGAAMAAVRAPTGKKAASKKPKASESSKKPKASESSKPSVKASAAKKSPVQRVTKGPSKAKLVSVGGSSSQGKAQAPKRSASKAPTGGKTVRGIVVPLEEACPSDCVQLLFGRGKRRHYVQSRHLEPVHVGALVVHREVAGFKQVKSGKPVVDITVGNQWAMTVRHTGKTWACRWPSMALAVAAVKRANAEVDVPWYLMDEEGSMPKGGEGALQQWNEVLRGRDLEEQGKSEKKAAQSASAKGSKPKSESAKKVSGKSIKKAAEVTEKAAEVTEKAAEVTEKSSEKTSEKVSEPVDDAAMVAKLKTLLSDKTLTREIRAEMRNERRAARSQGAST